MSLPTPKPGTGLMTIAFDLDGTLAEPTWPSPIIGKPIQRAVDALLEYHERGYEAIIFTSRPASHLDSIRVWLFANGLHNVIYDIVTDKPRAAMYVDDRAVTFPEAFVATTIHGPDDPLVSGPDDPFVRQHLRRFIG